MSARNVVTPARVQELLASWQPSWASAALREEIVRRGCYVGSEIRCHPALPRAMAEARMLISQRAAQGRAMPGGMVLLADHLTACKGRFQRTWFAPQGGCWGCLADANTLLPEHRSFIPYAVGVACCESLREFGAPQASLRWVNDVLVAGQKIAGFLVEGFTEQTHGEEFSLIGFGININNTSFPDELQGTAVSLRQVLGAEVDLAAFTALFLSRLAFYLGLLHTEEARALAGEAYHGPDGSHLLLARWRQLSDSLGRRVTYGFDVITAPQYEATVLALDPSGGIELELAAGGRKIEYSGEIRYLD